MCVVEVRSMCVRGAVEVCGLCVLEVRLRCAVEVCGRGVL